jgi:hypothetical protein
MAREKQRNILRKRPVKGSAVLLNATFGNAAELIIAVMAIQAGLYDVVKGIDHRLDHRQYPFSTRCCIACRRTQTQDADHFNACRRPFVVNDAHTGVDRTHRTGGLPLFRREQYCFTGGGPERRDIDCAGGNVRIQFSVLAEDAQTALHRRSCRSSKSGECRTSCLMESRQIGRIAWRRRHSLSRG